MSTPEETRGRLIAVVVAVALLASAIGQAVGRWGSEAPIDFYHFWGIQAARSVAPEDLGQPWENLDGYARVLNDAASTSEEPSFRQTNSMRRQIDPTSPPLAYALFAWLPDDFLAARRLFVLAQLGAFAAGVFLVARDQRVGSGPAFVFAAAATASFLPFLFDARLGNVNSFQLVAVGVALALTRTTGRWGATTLPLTVLIALAKPNQAACALLIAVARLVRVGRARALVEVGLGAAAAVALVVASGLWIGSLDAWSGWFAYLITDDPGKLPGYPADRGMIASPGRLAGWLGGGPYLWAAILLAIVAAGFALACRRARRADRLRGFLSDPAAMGSFGVVAVFAAGPLAWFHYYVLALLPALKLVVGRGRIDAAVGLGLAALALYWGPLLAWQGAYGAIQTLISFAWAPLLVGLILCADAPD